MFEMFFTFAVLSSVFPEVPAFKNHYETIQNVRSNQRSTWEAGPNSLTEYDVDTLAILAGTKPTPIEDLRKLPVRKPGTEATNRLTLPTNFDARTAWPNCATIKEIRSQGMCGSCWAQTGVSVLSDRICIASPGQNVNVKLAVQDPLICNGGDRNLCNGGQVEVPYVMFINKGIVTGGDYASNEGCMPYGSYPLAAALATNSSSCNSTCSNPLFTRTYTQDKYFGTTYYAMGNLFTSGPLGGASVSIKNESVIRQIQYELMINGPMTAVIQLYQDLYAYKSGVYQYTTGESVGGHSAKLMGWGTENSVDYWLLANSWGTGWGMGGFFKVIRGINHLGIEDYLITGLARRVTTTTGATTMTTSTTTKPTTKSTSTTTTTPFTMPPKSGRPTGYDRCDQLFCYDKPDGDYYLSPCSIYYCKCRDKLPHLQQCTNGTYYDKSTSVCRSPNDAFCSPRQAAPLSKASWPAVPALLSKACNLQNCQGRGGQHTWYTLGLCSPYWCYCWSDMKPPQQAAQTCPPGMLFDFRTEKGDCASPSDLVWCSM